MGDGCGSNRPGSPKKRFGNRKHRLKPVVPKGFLFDPKPNVFLIFLALFGVFWFELVEVVLLTSCQSGSLAASNA